MARPPHRKWNPDPELPILQLKVRLLDVSPMVWRRLLIPAVMTLRELHGVLQVAMGWEGVHLYVFELRARRYGSPNLCTGNPEPPDY
ncbi:plasmid pRiA4b ORF-3 family protein [Azospirillum thiophilum]|uniref:plasmid pRiA4b ORF-3 family protein n=1 Tax=Azospirillum thiophilum TaxID=528244 RepID=UPI0007C68CD2|nr:plasmid pRiA4b ORF-3 family protein [Azospirillum thiophilum]